MSFSSETKTELAHIYPEKKNEMLAELAGFMRLAGTVVLLGFGKFRIELTTENPAVARHYRKLMKMYFSVDAEIEVGVGEALHKRRRYILRIDPDQLSEQILRETGLLMVREGMNYITDGIYSGIIRKKSEKKAYLRGAFLGAGTMTNPEKQYHFEIVCSTERIASDLKSLFNSFVDIHALTTSRQNVPVVYLKSASQILDILAIMGANTQYFAYENVRLTKELRNEANRRSNCDQANIDKALAAAERQVENIRKIQQSKGLAALPPKLKAVAELRLAHPEVSITELGQMLDPPLKKSGVNNRLAKIAKMAEEL